MNNWVFHHKCPVQHVISTPQLSLRTNPRWAVYSARRPKTKCAGQRKRKPTLFPQFPSQPNECDTRTQGKATYKPSTTRCEPLGASDSRLRDNRHQLQAPLQHNRILIRDLDQRRRDDNSATSSRTPPGPASRGRCPAVGES